MTPAGRDDLFDFSLHLLEGGDDKLFSLSALRGTPVWLQFFASWCGPCNAEAPDVVRIAAKYTGSIAAVGIDAGETPAHARAFRDAHGITFPISLDQTKNVFHGLGFKGLPTHVFIDAQGFFSCVSVGDLTAEQMDNEVAVAIARNTDRGMPAAPPPR